MTAIEKIEKRAAQIKAGECERVKPGMATRFTEASTVGDEITQGDLCFVIVDAVPAGFTVVKKPQAIDKQLVPGNTKGAKHCLKSLGGVKLYRPANWDGESLEGPCLVTSKEATVLHPTHGAVTIPAGFTVQCFYPREWDKEQAKERRNAD